MRRLLVLCALTAMVFAALAGLQRKSSDAAGTTNNIKLTAPAPQPGCPLGSAFTFCNSLVGGTTSQSVFTVTNTSAATVTNVVVSFVALTGQSGSFNAADFTAVSTTCGASLAASASCTVNVAFTPTATGLRFAALTIKDTQNDSAALNLVGTGSNLALAPPASPAGCTQNNAFTFCNVLPGGLSAASQFTLAAKNAVTGVTIALAAVPGLASEFNALDFTENSACGGALGPNSTCAVNIQFTPTVNAGGLRSAELNVTDAQGDAVTIFLAGLISSTGNTTSNLTLTPSGTPPACAFGNGFGYCNEPTGGTTANSVFTLTNTSGTQVTGVKIPFPVIPTPPALPTLTDFTVTSSACAATLPAGASCAINIAFTPTATGSRQSSITVTDAQGDAGMTNLTGFGDDYQLQLATGQAAQVTVAPGGTATFKGQVVSDGTFGMQGEQVSFGCPVNLPNLTTCAFSPCPVIVTPGTPMVFSIVFVTSSPTVTALPPTGGACPGASTAILIYAPKGPVQTPSFAAASMERFHSRGWLFPALAGVGLLMLFAFGFAPPAPRRAIRALAIAAFAAAALAGCHHKAAPVGGTSTGQTMMIIQGQALDSSGRALNTSRTMPQFVLDVEKN